MHILAKRILTGLALSASFTATFFYLPPFVLSFLFILALLAVLAFEWPKILSTKGLAFWLVTPLYPVLPFALLITLNQNNYQRILVFVVISLTALYDTGAYTAGKVFGKHKIAPSISPQKTWEGLFGGYALTLSATLIMSHYNLINIPLSLTLTFAALISGTAFLGDLFESWLKRKALIKDSSNILPGHGGILDRFDGILAVTCVIYLLKNCLT